MLGGEEISGGLTSTTISEGIRMLVTVITPAVACHW